MEVLLERVLEQDPPERLRPAELVALKAKVSGVFPGEEFLGPEKRQPWENSQPWLKESADAREPKPSVSAISI